LGRASIRAFYARLRGLWRDPTSQGTVGSRKRSTQPTSAASAGRLASRRRTP
jgi:hypothetical protein